ncbi:helix-turn-helix domain-containing protein [Kitasatospora sp. LaBMicrA B282]|uniref:helix-turn-helix domain-containing protein n=1 Tax=Kitasatospora sp. LaBMicrA B282 TaxID=3420949 RepID=UPI003D0EA3E6
MHHPAVPAAPAVQALETGDLAVRPPHPALADHLLCYAVRPLPLSGPRLRQVTGPTAALLSIEVAPARGAPGAAVLVLLTAPGARALLGRPLGERPGDPGGPSGARTRELAACLAAAPDWPTRFTLLDDRLARWIAAGPPLPVPVHRAWRLIAASAGRAPIGTVATEVGWSRQHLNSRFRHELGLSPKAAARNARLHRAAALLRRPDPPLGATVAAACGYCDQSHLDRDFRDLAGCTPTAFAARRTVWDPILTAPGPADRPSAPTRPSAATRPTAPTRPTRPLP